MRKAKVIPPRPSAVLEAADQLNAESGRAVKQNPTGIPVHLYDATRDSVMSKGAAAMCGAAVRTQSVADHGSPDACPACLAKWRAELEGNRKACRRFTGALA
jgi:hypothetical protein